MSGRRTASPARQRAPSPSGGRKPAGGASYSSLLAEIERTSVPKPGARPPTDVGTTEEGREWLAKNAQQDGVVTLPCGMQYKVLKAAKADAASPKLATECMCHYTGKRTDGFEFDSSKKRGKPACFAPKNVIRGWTIAMQIMGVGDKWMLYIPSEYAYGDAGRRDERRGEYIPPGQVLVFELELLEVNGPSKPRPKRPADMPNASTPTAVVGPAAVVDVSEVAPSVEPEMETEMVRPPTAPPTKGAPVFLSATNSMAPSKPLPRTSPTSG